jgi:hypothetical protein
MKNEVVKIIFQGLPFDIWYGDLDTHLEEGTGEISPHQFFKPNRCPESTSSPTNKHTI